MKVKFNTEELKKVLSKLAAVVAKKAAVPVYGYVRLFAVQAAGSLGYSVAITGVDIDATLTVAFTKAEPEGPVDVLLPFTKLMDILSGITAPDVTIDTDGETKARIKAARFTGEMKPRPLTEWPQILERPEAAKAVVGLAGFKDQIAKIVFAVPANDGKYTVTVAKLESTAAELKFIATDGFGLAISTSPANYGAFEMTLPKPALELVSKLEGSQLTIAEAEGGFYFDTELETLTVSRSHGTFPDYKAIVPAKFTTKISLDKETFSLALKRTKALADAEKPVIVFAVEENGKELSLKAASLETIAEGTAFRQMADDTIDATVEGPAADFSLNVAMTLPFLDKATGPIVIQVTKNTEIVDFHGNADAYRWLQMPTQPATRV